MSREIRLTQGKVALVDDEDYDRVVAFGTWHAATTSVGIWYARCSVKTGRGWRCVLMHRLILGLGAPRPLVDHKDGDGLNNCRRNLRLATDEQNTRNARLRRDNSSGYKGVHFHKNAKLLSGGRWRARIKVGGKRHRIGDFATAKEAALAYDVAAREVHGEFAVLNFPQEVARA